MSEEKTEEKGREIETPSAQGGPALKAKEIQVAKPAAAAVKASSPKRAAKAPRWLTPLLGGLAFGFLFPVLVWDQAFNTPIGWTFGVGSTVLGAIAGWFASVALADD